MVDIQEFDPSEIDDDNYEGMPELCDSDSGKKETVTEVHDDIGDGDRGGEKEEEAPPPRSVDADGWEDILGSGRLRKKILREGDETRGKPPRGASCTVHVVERLAGAGAGAGGAEVGREQGLVFHVGEAEVVAALDMVAPLMFPGELAIVTAEHTFGYGVAGDGSRVPGSSDLELEVELVEWAELGAVPDMERASRLDIGMRKRERGNKHFTRGDYSTAIQCYRKAAEYLDDKQIEDDMEVPIDRFLLPKDLQTMLEERVKTFNNMAQSQMKLTAWDSALASIRQVLKIEPNNEKALFRKAKILIEKCQMEEAMGILRRVSRLYPNNKQSQAELTRLTSKQKKNREKEQMLSRKMLGLDSAPATPPHSAFFSGPVKIALAALGGLGAVAATFLMKHYNVY